MTETLVALLLDKSNSMASKKAATLEAYNGFVEGLVAPDADIAFSLVLFDTSSTVTVCKNVPVASAPRLTAATYRPENGHSTPLIDAAVKTIKAVEAAVMARGSGKVVFAIQTDGEENSSREYKHADLIDLIKAKTERGWQFIFLGCGIDAYQQGAQYGFSQANTVSYAPDERSTTAVFAAMASNTRGFASGGRGSTEFTSAQKFAAGDTFDPSLAGGAVTAGGPAGGGGSPTAAAPKPIVEDVDLT